MSKSSWSITCCECNVPFEAKVYTKRCPRCKHACDDCVVKKIVKIPDVETRKDLAGSSTKPSKQPKQKTCAGSKCKLEKKKEYYSDSESSSDESSEEEVKTRPKMKRY